MTNSPGEKCSWCGRKTHSPKRVCQDCIGIESYTSNVPTKTDALTGGRWVIDRARRIQVWEPFYSSLEDVS